MIYFGGKRGFYIRWYYKQYSLIFNISSLLPFTLLLLCLYIVTWTIYIKKEIIVCFYFVYTFFFFFFLSFVWISIIIIILIPFLFTCKKDTHSFVVTSSLPFFTIITIILYMKLCYTKSSKRFFLLLYARICRSSSFPP